MNKSFMLSYNWVYNKNGQDCILTNVLVFRSSPQVSMLHTVIRDKTTSRDDFIFHADRLIRLLVEEGLCFLPMKNKNVITPTESVYNGSESDSKICAVPIMRSGEAMEEALRQVCRAIRICKILIQRDEETAEPKLIYYKGPEDIKNRWCFLLDPMLATGGSACMAINQLVERGVPEDHIIFLNLISCPEGLLRVNKEYPNVKIVTTQVDDKLNEKKYILPGCGDFGDRYFGTKY